jgi:hypothetical protein
MEWHGLSTREWASVFWAVVVLVVFLAVPQIRSTFARVLRTFLQFWKIHVTLLAFLGWVVGVLYVGHWLGAWNRGLLKDTIAWVLVFSFPTVFSALKAAKEDRFFRRAALSTLSVAALMQFLLNLHTFSIWVELALQPIVTLVLLISTVAALKPETAQVGKIMDGLLGIIGIWVILATAQGLWGSWRGLDPKQTGLSFAFSIWFPLAMLPFVYVFALVMAYGQVFVRMPFLNDSTKPPLSHTDTAGRHALHQVPLLDHPRRTAPVPPPRRPRHRRPLRPPRPHGRASRRHRRPSPSTRGGVPMNVDDIIRAHVRADLDARRDRRERIRRVRADLQRRRRYAKHRSTPRRRDAAHDRWPARTVAPRSQHGTGPSAPAEAAAATPTPERNPSATSPPTDTHRRPRARARGRRVTPRLFRTPLPP